MNTWSRLQTGLFAVLYGGVLLVLSKSLLYPATVQLSQSSFQFPKTVHLSGWQTLPGQPLKNLSQAASLHSGYAYRYAQPGLALEITMRYLIGTDGDLKTLLNRYQSGTMNLNFSPSSLRERAGIGHYLVYTHQGKAYLSSCINPAGGSTVTGIQFQQNRHAYDLRLDRLLPWLLGQADLQDQRCLWANLTLPLQQLEPERAYQILETAWFSWYGWWQSRFPQG